MRQMPRLKKPENTLDRIAFFGPMCSGKTWAADYLANNYQYGKASFASKIKSIVYDLFGDVDKNDNRALFQNIGQSMREYDPDVWIKYTLNRIYESDWNRWVIDDLRYVNEAKILKRNGFFLILVSTPEDVRAERVARLYPATPPETHRHASEQEWLGIRPDAVVSGYHVNTVVDIERLLSRVDL